MQTLNNFNQLRLLAALLVLFSHSVPLSSVDSSGEVMFVASRGQATFGMVAVSVFFIISGYLITESFTRYKNAKYFVIARALRLMPGLAFALIVLTFIVGPVVTTAPLSTYFGSEKTFRFLIGNLSMAIVKPADPPGLFAANPLPVAFDGSLWTLTYETACYVLVFCLGVIGLLNRWVVTALFAVALAASKAWVGGSMVNFGIYFLGGATMYFWKPPLRGWIAGLCALLLLASMATGGFRLACATAGAYAVIYLAVAAPPLPRFPRSDLSYGVYIWAFPAQQIAAMLLPRLWWVNALASLPFVIGIAWLSWRFIEAPALQLKHWTRPGSRTMQDSGLSRG